MWNRTWTLAEIEKGLGKDHVAFIRSQANPVAYCESRAAGWWQANDGEHYSQYKSLATILRAA